MSALCIEHSNDNYLKLYKNIDICVNINVYQECIFLNKLKNNILKNNKKIKKNNIIVV